MIFLFFASNAVFDQSGNEVKGKKSVPNRWFKGKGRCHLCELRATRAAREAGIKVKDVDPDRVDAPDVSHLQSAPV